MKFFWFMPIYTKPNKRNLTVWYFPAGRVDKPLPSDSNWMVPGTWDDD